MVRGIGIAGTLLAALCIGGCGSAKKDAATDEAKPTKVLDGKARPRVCGKAPQLRWPLRGREGRDWVINNYVDVAANSGTHRDYTGAAGPDAKTYVNHTGVDIDISSFRQMDGNTPVLAAADGVIVEFDDTQPDRNTSCTGKWNYMHVRHASGYVLTYGHLKKKSISLKRGQRVSAGAVIASVGSSGCSTQPHLHFEVRDCNRVVKSPFAERMWKSPRDYTPRLQLMDVLLRTGGHEGIATLKDPKPNPTSIKPGEVLGLGLSVSGGDDGDSVGFRVTQADGTPVLAPKRELTKPHRHAYWHWRLRAPNTPTKLNVEVVINGSVVWKRTLDVRN